MARDRLYDTRGVFELTLVNDSDDEVAVTDAALVADLFEPMPPDDRVTRVPPRNTRSRPITYGAARCHDDADTDLALRYEIGGDEHEQRLGPASGGIMRLHAQLCAEQAVRDAVDIGFGDDWRVVEPTRAQGTIVLDRKADAEVVLDEVFTQIVFVTTPVSSLPSDPADDVVMRATAARCDAHALTESKKTFLFTLVFHIDGAEARLELRATEQDGAVLDAMKQAVDDCVAARDAAGAH